MLASFTLAVVVIGTDIVIASLLVVGARRALVASGKPLADIQRIISVFGFVLFAWLAATLILAWSGVFETALNQPFPYIAVAIMLPILAGALLIRHSESVKSMIDAVPQSQLVAVQFYRVVGATFLVLYATGRLPSVFALPAGWGDVFVGITALLVAFESMQNRGRALVAMWNWFGIADLVVAVGTGFLSAPTRFQIFSLDAPNTMIGSFPLVMIPIFAVPISFILHLASLTKLHHESHRTASGIGALRA